MHDVTFQPRPLYKVGLDILLQLGNLEHGVVNVEVVNEVLQQGASSVRVKVRRGQQTRSPSVCIRLARNSGSWRLLSRLRNVSESTVRKMLSKSSNRCKMTRLAGSKLHPGVGQAMHPHLERPDTHDSDQARRDG